MTVQWYEKILLEKITQSDSNPTKLFHIFFSQQVLDMIDRVDLRPDIVTYGVMAMACINREQAQQFREKLIERGIR